MENKSNPSDFQVKRDSLFGNDSVTNSGQDHPLMKKLKLSVQGDEVFQLTDHGRLGKKGVFYGIQTLISWILQEETLNPNWIFVKNRNDIKKAVFLEIGKVNIDLWENSIKSGVLSTLKKYDDHKFYAKLSSHNATPGRNLWPMIFGTPVVKKRESMGKGWSGYQLSDKELKVNSYPSLEYNCCNDFVNTSIWDHKIDYNNVLGIDCEMVETENGHELAQICVIDKDFEKLYEYYVKPEKPVLNYHFQFSGITQSDIESATKTLEDVQNDQKSYMNKDTILVGHSLENDLFALKMIHDKVVDTSVLFSTRHGTKLQLKQLSWNWLKYKIQSNEKNKGHDPAEDANAAMGLAKYKIEILDPLGILGDDSKNSFEFLEKISKKFKILVLDKTEQIKPLLNDTGIMFKNIDNVYFTKQFETLHKYAKKLGESGNNSAPDLQFAKLDFFTKNQSIDKETLEQADDKAGIDKTSLIKKTFESRAAIFDKELEKFLAALPKNTLVVMNSFNPYSYKDLWEKYGATESSMKNPKSKLKVDDEKSLSDFNKKTNFFTAFVKD